MAPSESGGCWSQVGGVSEGLGAVRALVGLDDLRVHLGVDPAGEERREEGGSGSTPRAQLSSWVQGYYLMDGNTPPPSPLERLVKRTPSVYAAADLKSVARMAVR